MSAVIRKISPEEAGWIKIRDRVWVRPEDAGSLYEFPPGQPEVLFEYRRVAPNTLLDLTK